MLCQDLIKEQYDFNPCPFINLYRAQIKFPIQKLTIFRKVKGIKELRVPLMREQVIPQIDPREIGSAFHRASAETCPPHRQRHL